MYEKFKRRNQALINAYHLAKAVIANFYFGFPSKKLKVIGVTGTDGKTTTTLLIYHILKSAGKKASMISSIYAKIGEQEFSTGLHVTTPDGILVQKLLKDAVDQSDEYFVLETTSHGLDQNRVWGIKFKIGVVTNITDEHLDYHKTYDRYFKAKAKLLLNSAISVINRDDSSYERLKQLLESKGKKIYTYGLKNKSDFIFTTKYNTEFNNYNYSAAYAVASLLDIRDNKITAAANSFQLPAGRLETVYNKNFKIIVDFAHTPNSLNNVLAAVEADMSKKGEKESRLIHVFGSAGLRDNAKRSKMGQASATYADVIILTEEDYRTEDPIKICRQIGEGIINKGKTYEVITDRQKAIQKAVQMARKDDVVVLTGKSHEKSLARGKKEYPWDEFEAVKKALSQRKA